MSKEKQRKEDYEDIEYYLSKYRELKSRMRCLDEVIEDAIKSLKEKKD